jgi:hypothetical protein
MPNTHGNRGRGADNAAEDLARVQRDKQIIAQRLEDVPLRVIASKVGCALSTVQAAVKRWMTEHRPPNKSEFAGTGWIDMCARA